MPQQKLTFSEWEAKLVLLTAMLRTAAEEVPAASRVKIQPMGHCIKLSVGSYRPSEALISLDWLANPGSNEFILAPAIKIVEGDMTGDYEGLRSRASDLLLLIDLMGTARVFLAGIEVHSVPR